MTGTAVKYFPAETRNNEILQIRQKDQFCFIFKLQVSPLTIPDVCNVFAIFVLANALEQAEKIR